LVSKASLVVTGACALVACSHADPDPGPTASIRGDVFAFISEVSGPRVAGATISVLEDPSKSAVTDAGGHFEIDGLPVGSEATLVLSHPDFYPTQSATYTVGPNGIDPFAFQVLSQPLFKLLSSLFTNIEQETHCAIATTITRLGGTVHVHVRQGEPGATLTIAPTAADMKGPIYFNEQVIPDMKLAATTKDGGALYYHVPPGIYTISATKPGYRFTPQKVICRAGFLVNAGPPLGVQASVALPDWGSRAAPDAYSAATDALCAKTAECSNAKNGAGAYPPITMAGCQGTFRRALGFVDATCDAQTHVRDAWKAFFACRTASCTLALGDDSACASEEKAYVAAMDAYAPCYSARH
jgi:hypothetical protein